MRVLTKEKSMPRYNDSESIQDLMAQEWRDLESRIQPTPEWEVREIDNAVHGED